MMVRMNRRFMSVVLVSLLGVSLGVPAVAQSREGIPQPEREFRAAWVATVANIDWPSEPGLSTEVQQQEAVAILEKATEVRLNAIVLQVRAHTDAFYKSDLEPWSYYLTGQQGKAPDPYYDPLEFWVKEAHARGLELHVWFNPYRANHPAMKGEMSEKAIVKTHPELVKKLGDKGYYWMDPALKGTQDHSVAVVMDVVKRYDIDGAHFDDYFYPYPDYNDGKDFPDDDSWAAYQASGGTLSRNDWRREAVNVFIKRIYDEIKATKPHVKFGLSPFGIWRPGYPESIRGFDQYDTLYADAKLWLNEGWVDYYTPQLYWPINRIAQSYPVLLGWWAGQNTRERHLWPGLSIGQAGREGGAREIVNEIMVTRGIVPAGPGNVFFSMKTLLRNRGEINDALLEGPYRKPALVPACPWLDADAPDAPKVAAGGAKDAPVVEWEARGAEPAFLWVVYKEQDGAWSYDVLPSGERRLALKMGEDAKPVSRVAVSAVDRTGNESKPTVVKID